MSDPAIVNLDDLHRAAKLVLPKMIYDYYSSGSNDQKTLNANERDFDNWLIIPRILINVSNVRTDLTINGQRIESPIGIAPTAMQKMAHPIGELATFSVAASKNHLAILSSWSTTSMEDIYQTCPQSLKWFQLYVYKDKRITTQLIKRAEACGFKALVVTVDTPLLGMRENDVRNGFRLPAGLTLANFSIASESESRNDSKSSFLADHVQANIDSSLTWDDIAWLRSITKLDIILKGILSVKDAEKALQYNVQGIIVSNHGGRQLDTAPSTISCFPGIAKAVGHKIPLYLDGGIRRGTDVLKAMSLGARAVFIGRPVLWGLAYNGDNGVSLALDIINKELKLAMALVGCTSLDAINPFLCVLKSQL